MKAKVPEEEKPQYLHLCFAKLALMFAILALCFAILAVCFAIPKLMFAILALMFVILTLSESQSARGEDPPIIHIGFLPLPALSLLSGNQN